MSIRGYRPKRLLGLLRHANKKEARTSSALTEAIETVKNPVNQVTVALKTKHIEVCPTPQTTKAAFHNNHTQIWVGEILHFRLARMKPSLRLEASFPVTRQGNQIQEPANSDTMYKMIIYESSYYYYYYY